MERPRFGVNKFEPGLAETTQGPGGNKFGPSSTHDGDQPNLPKRPKLGKNTDGVSETSQGPGGDKFGPNSPLGKDGHHCPKRPKLNGESGVSLQQRCEHFFVGDEVAKPTRYRVYGKSESARLLGRRG